MTNIIRHNLIKWAKLAKLTHESVFAQNIAIYVGNTFKGMMSLAEAIGLYGENQIISITEYEDVDSNSLRVDAIRLSRLKSD